VDNYSPEFREIKEGWLAISPPDCPYSIGVVGHDRDEARRKFVVALEAWEELHEQAATEKAQA